MNSNLAIASGNPSRPGVRSSLAIRMEKQVAVALLPWWSPVLSRLQYCLHWQRGARRSGLDCL